MDKAKQNNKTTTKNRICFLSTRDSFFLKKDTFMIIFETLDLHYAVRKVLINQDDIRIIHKRKFTKLEGEKKEIK